MCECIRYDVFSKSNIKARINHKCCECGNAILKNNLYVYIVTIMNRKVNTYKICDKCDFMHDHISFEMGECREYGNLKGQFETFNKYYSTEYYDQ